MDTPSPLAITTELTGKMEELASQWEAEGHHQDAAHLRTFGPDLAVQLAKAAHSPMGVQGVVDVLESVYRRQAT
ncbi:hypothetical protein [Streptomyces sp. NPDC048157]|uniref:hypothetical protein n=1 Tax=Streptomyces sp. NPDC048157 TaxID=3365503 RepID=UPI00371D1E4F